VAGLLALMLLTDARRAARTGEHGELVPLDEQDRTRWNRELIDEGTALVEEALRRGAVGPYQLQAAVAAVHDEARRAEDTDWPQVLALYAVLRRMTDNPMVGLSHAVAVAMVRGPGAGLDLLPPLERDARIAGHHRLDAVRAHLLEKAGHPDRAIAHYRAAAERTTSLPERDYLMARAARLAGPGPSLPPLLPEPPGLHQPEGRTDAGPEGDSDPCPALQRVEHGHAEEEQEDGEAGFVHGVLQDGELPLR
jgi:predicted RNA polymerase sigma factor